MASRCSASLLAPCSSGAQPAVKRSVAQSARESVPSADLANGCYACWQAADRLVMPQSHRPMLRMASGWQCRLADPLPVASRSCNAVPTGSPRRQPRRGGHRLKLLQMCKWVYKAWRLLGATRYANLCPVGRKSISLQLFTSVSAALLSVHTVFASKHQKVGTSPALQPAGRPLQYG